MSSKLKVILFLSSTRVGHSYTGTGSWGDRVGILARQRLESAGCEVSVWDPKKMEFPLLEQPIQMIPDKSTVPQWLMDRKQEIEEADAFLSCVTEYNAAIPPAFTNMLCHFPPASFRHRPMGIITYSMGSGGGLRISAPLKAMVTDMGMTTVPASVKVDFVHKKFNDKDECIDEKLPEYIDRMVTETIWYAEAIRNHKQATGLPSA